MGTLELPEDLVEEILCRLPATSLSRLRSTCKRWNYLFTKDKKFSRKHLDKAPKQLLALMWDSRLHLTSLNLHEIVPSVELSGELNLINPLSGDQLKFGQVFHCDGLLLCTDGKEEENSIRLVVWNPCTGQTKWVQTTKRNRTFKYVYALGSYQDNKTGNNCYKVMSCGCKNYYHKEVFEIYELESNTWRILDVTPDCKIEIPLLPGVSLKEKTYWVNSYHENLFLVSFDYTTEEFGRLSLPIPTSRCEIESLLFVREDKLSVLLQPKNTSRIELWVANKLDETNAVSWSMVLAVDSKPQLEMQIRDNVSFLLDEEKKVMVCCEAWHDGNMVYIVGGEDNILRKKELGFLLGHSCMFNYVPSLTHILQGDA